MFDEMRLDLELPPRDVGSHLLLLVLLGVGKL